MNLSNVTHVSCQSKFMRIIYDQKVYISCLGSAFFLLFAAEFSRVKTWLLYLYLVFFIGFCVFIRESVDFWRNTLVILQDGKGSLCCAFLWFWWFCNKILDLYGLLVFQGYGFMHSTIKHYMCTSSLFAKELKAKKSCGSNKLSLWWGSNKGTQTGFLNQEKYNMSFLDLSNF